MAKLEKAIITKKIVRPYSGVQEPEVGMTGHIIEHEDTPVKHTCIRFLAKTLGYSYDPEYDDAHRKYVRIFVPNNNFEIVKPVVKTTKKESKSKESTVNSKKAEKMKQPDIMYTLGTDWKILPGHKCFNQEEMEEFIRKMDPTGCMMKVVDLAKIKDEIKNKVAPKKVEKMKQPEIMMNLGGNWQSLPGHGCYNQKEMEEYVRELDPNGSMLKVMDLAEVKNDTKPTKKKM
jgi:hypothetical protein